MEMSAAIPSMRPYAGPGAARFPAILLTAEDSEETKIAARNMGANRLLKPSSPASLRALISTCLVQGSREGSHIDAESATG